MSILITGAAGFIGSHFYDLVGGTVIDSLTYAADRSRVDPRDLVAADIRSPTVMKDILLAEKPDVLVNFAAESHVDNSYLQAQDFTRSNVEGVVNLLDSIRSVSPGTLFVQISTDEVYGDEPVPHNAYSPLNPQNPYAATKAAAEFMVRSYARAFGLRFMIIRPSNNWGPRQHGEKLIPAAVRAKLENRKLALHGVGLSRDFIHVKDCVRAISELLHVGSGIWNVATGRQIPLELVLQRVGVEYELSRERPGVDRGYWVDPSRTWQFLDWSPVSWEVDTRWDEYMADMGLVTVG